MLKTLDITVKKYIDLFSKEYITNTLVGINC